MAKVTSFLHVQPVGFSIAALATMRAALDELWRLGLLTESSLARVREEAKRIVGAMDITVSGRPEDRGEIERVAASARAAREIVEAFFPEGLERLPPEGRA